MFIVDTDVVSELRKAKSDKADPGVTAWAESVDASTLFISAVSLSELEEECFCWRGAIPCRETG